MRRVFNALSNIPLKPTLYTLEIYRICRITFMRRVFNAWSKHDLRAKSGVSTFIFYSSFPRICRCKKKKRWVNQGFPSPEINNTNRGLTFRLDFFFGDVSDGIVQSPIKSDPKRRQKNPLSRKSPRRKPDSISTYLDKHKNGPPRLCTVALYLYG